MIEIQNDKKSKEIDILLLVERIWKERGLLLKICVVAGLVGVVIALNTPKAYTTSVLLAPESDDASSLNKLGGVTSMLGIKLGTSMSSDAIYPMLYPEVLASTDFLIGLFHVPVKTVDDEQGKSYYAHLTQDISIPFWTYPKIWILKLFKDKSGEAKPFDPFWLTKEQTGVCNVLRSRISCIVDKKTDMITISVTDNDKLVSALMADTVMTHLQKYITMYRTKKARHDLLFMENLYEQSEKDYIKAQKNYALAADANQSLFLTASKIELKNLENEMQLKYEVYSGVAQQLHLAKERVQENTPAFTVIQSATVPDQASSFPRSFMVIVYVILGIMLDILWVLVLRDSYHKIMRKKNK